MVLEEAITLDSDSTETFRNDSSPSSDSDPYSSPTSSSASVSSDTDMGQMFPNVFPSGYRIPIDKLSTSIPLIGPLFGFTKPLQLKLIIQSSSATAQTIKRPLTEDESNAMAYHTAKALNIASYGTPVGVGGSLIQWWKTQSKMKFPFYQPDLEKYKFQSFGPLKGNNAYKFWQSLRLTSYAMIGGWVGKTFFAAYAATVMMTGQHLDKRLDDVHEIQKKILQQRLGSPHGQRTVAPDQKRNTEGNDALVTFENYASSSRVGPPNDPQTRSAEWQQQTPGYSGQSEESKTTAGFGFDTPAPENESMDSGKGNTSAWDRLREGAGTSNRTPPPGTSRTSGGNNDAWANVREGDAVSQDQAKKPAGDDMVDDDKKWK